MKKFWLYWKENFTLAKDGFDIMVLILSGVLLVIVAICQFFHFTNPIEKFISDAGVEKLAGIGAALFLTVWCFFWLPYKRHEAEMTKLASIGNEKMMDHDIKIFEAMNAKGDEGRITDICHAIMTNRVVDSEGLDLLHWLLRHGEKTGNEFMMPSVKTTYKDFYKALDQFVTLVSTVFFALPDPHPEPSDFYHGLCINYALYPDLKEYPPDHEKRKIYDKAHDEITDAGINVLASYDKFRREVKNVLFV